jgi:hypothetical protein
MRAFPNRKRSFLGKRRPFFPSNDLLSCMLIFFKKEERIGIIVKAHEVFFLIVIVTIVEGIRGSSSINSSNSISSRTISISISSVSMVVTFLPYWPVFSQAQQA